MSDAAITLPLDVVQRLIDLAEDTAPDDTSALDLAKAEVAQVKKMIEEMRQHRALRRAPAT